MAGGLAEGIQKFLFPASLGVGRFDTVQPRYNLLFRQIERDLLPLCREEALAVIPYNPLAGGLLSGKHRRETGPTPGTRFTLGNAAGRYQDRYWHEREFATVEALRPLVVGRMCVSQHGAHARGELAKAERFCHVVVSAQIKAAHAFRNGIASRDDQHRNWIVTRPNRP